MSKLISINKVNYHGCRPIFSRFEMMGDSCEKGTASFGRSPSVTYGFLTTSWHKALRNGSWASITSMEKALYRCALWIAKTRGSIINTALVAQILVIVRRFFEGIRSRILAVGRKRAGSMLKNYSSQGSVFQWAPQVKQWLQDSVFVFYLGVIQEAQQEP